MNRLLIYFQNRQTEISDKIFELVEIESPSFNISGNSQAVDWLETEARKISADFQIERIFAEACGEHGVRARRRGISEHDAECKREAQVSACHGTLLDGTADRLFATPVPRYEQR